MNLAQRTVKGIFWAYASFFGGRILTLVSTAILARLLVPEDFGLIGFSLVILAFIEVSRGFGINEALIYTSEKLDETADTAFAINILIGLLQTVLMIVAAPLALKFFDDPRIVDVIRFMSLSFILSAFGQTHDALLQKELEFKRRFVPDLLSTVIKGVLSIILALTGFGLWSLVIGHVVGTAARSIAKWYVLRWIPRLRFSIKRARELWGYGVHILMFELLNIILDQADQLLIGVMLGATQLGYYAIAVKIPEMVIANFSIVLTRVIFPTFAKMKNNIAELRRGFLATTQYTAFVTIPAGFGMAAVAPELILVVYGDQWRESILLLQVLAFLGMVQTIPWSAGDVLKAMGRPDISTKMLLLEAVYTFPLIIIMVSYSRLAVAASLANLIALSITAVFRLYVISLHLKLGIKDFVNVFRSPFIAAVSMFIGVSLWRIVLDGVPLPLVLLSSIALGGLIYAPLLWIMEREALMQVRDTFKSLRNKDDDEDSPDDFTSPENKHGGQHPTEKKKETGSLIPAENQMEASGFASSG